MKSRLNRFILASLLVHLLIIMLFSFQKVEQVKLQTLTVDLNISSQSSSSSSRKDSTSQAKADSRQNQQFQKNKVQSFRDLSQKSFTKQQSKFSTKSTTTILAKPTTSVKKFQKNKVQSFRDLSQKPSTKQQSKLSSKSTTTLTKPTTSVKKKVPSLIRNNQPPISQSLQSFSDVSENDIYDRQITLEKSKEIIQSRRPSSDILNQGEEQRRNNSEISGFEERSVFNESPAGTRGSGDQVSGSFDLKSSSSTSGASGQSKNYSADDASGKQSNKFKWKNSGQRSLISKSDLVFPQSLEGKGVNKDVVLVFKVAPDGKVYDIELAKSSGYSELDNAVKDQVRSFRFNNITGDKISEVEYRYLFTLEEKK